MKKQYIIIIYALIAIFMFINQETLLVLFQQSKESLIVFPIIIGTFFALFPIIPFPVIGGLFGAMYGTTLGTIVTWTASTAASLIIFVFIRYTFQSWGLTIIQRYRRLNTVTKLFEKNAFITILISRLIPFIPSIVINAYSAISRVSFFSYTIASSIGKIPSMLLFAILGHSVVSSNRDIWGIVTLYSLFLVIIIIVYRKWKTSILKKPKISS